MSNIFDSTNYPTQLPAELQIGDYWAWKRTDLASSYPLADYSLKYIFYLVSGSTASNFTIDASESNGEYVFATSSTVKPIGDYKWTAVITKTAGNVPAVIDTGYITIVSDAVRSHTKLVLDSIEAVIENRATMDQASMSIAGRSLSRMSIDELMTFKDRYKLDWLKEVKKARVKNNQGSGNIIKARFGSANTYNPTDFS